MTAVRFIRRENALGKLLRLPGGERISQSLERANANLASIRDAWLIEMEASFRVMEGLLAGSGRPSQEALAEALQRSNEIGGLAGTYGLEAMGEACFSLCELLDNMITEETWSAEAVAVHLHALLLLKSFTGDAEGNEVLLGLRKVAKFAGGRRDAV